MCVRRDRVKWDDETYHLAEYRSLFVLLDEFYRTVFVVQFGFIENREIRLFIKDFVDSVNSAPHLELTEPLKLYVFAVHVVEFVEKNVSQQIAKERRTCSLSSPAFTTPFNCPGTSKQ